MNRRQFLGRFFQGVQTLYNSNYGYGAYHNWPLKYVPINIQVKCYYRKTVNDKNELTSFMKQDTIIAIYDSSDEMIKCTAYYKNGVIINDFASNGCVAYNLKPGVYTVKVLQSGKGINLAGSASISISANVDRTNVINSNYGYVSSQDFTVEIIFDISGIYFNAESKLEAIGYWYPTGDNSTMLTQTYNFDAITDITSANITILQSWTSKMNTDQRYKVGPVYSLYSEIKAVELENISSSKSIGAMSLKDYPGMGSYELNNIALNNNLDFEDIWSSSIIIDTYYNGYNKDRVSMQSSTIYYYMPYTSLYSIHDTVSTGSEIYPNKYTVVGTASGGEINPNLNSAKAAIQSVRTSIIKDETRYWSYKYKYLYVNTSMTYQEFMYGNSRMSSVKPTYSESVSLDGNYGLPKKPPYALYTDAESTWEGMNSTARSVREATYRKYIYPALSNIDPENPSSDEPWLKTVTASDRTKNVPLDILFGYVTDCINVIGDPPTDTGDTSTSHEEEMGSKFVINGLSDYDPDKQINNDNMWIYVSSEIPALFLKQKPTPIDLDDIPDHKIG